MLGWSTHLSCAQSCETCISDCAHITSWLYAQVHELSRLFREPVGIIFWIVLLTVLMTMQCTRRLSRCCSVFTAQRNNVVAWCSDNLAVSRASAPGQRQLQTLRPASLQDGHGLLSSCARNMGRWVQYSARLDIPDPSIADAMETLLKTVWIAYQVLRG